MTEISRTVAALVTAVEDWNTRYSDTVTVIGEGLCYATVCTTLDDEAVDAAMAARPATVNRGWARSTDATFATGQPNPCPCEQRPDTNRHVLYEA